MSIHIVPIGLDSPERFMEGFKEYPPSKVIFLMGNNETEIEFEAVKIKEEVKNSIGKYVSIFERKAELFKFADAMKTFAQIITENKDEHPDELIYINISSSTKVITQAAYIAASLFSARIYYVPAETYLSTELLPLLNCDDEELKKQKVYDFISDKKYLSMGVKQAYEIPVLKMQPPNKTELDVLEAINSTDKKKYNSVKDLVKNGLQMEYTGSRRNKYSQIIKKLQINGFISTTRSGREKGIKLTNSGKVIAEISDILLSSK